MIKPLAFTLARRLLKDPRVQAWALDQAIKIAPHVAGAARRAAEAAKGVELPGRLVKGLRGTLKRTPVVPPAPESADPPGAAKRTKTKRSPSAKRTAAKPAAGRAKPTTRSSRRRAF